MNTSIKTAIAFLGGIAVGAAGVLVWLRKDYAHKVEELSGRLDKTESQAKETKSATADTKDRESIRREMSRKMSERLGYSGGNDPGILVREERDYTAIPKDDGDLPFEMKEKGGTVINTIPYEINGESFIHDRGNDKVTLIWYEADDVVAEEDGTIVQNVKDVLGENWKGWIGHYEEDAAFVRNERFRSDYEVCREQNAYSEFYGGEDDGNDD